MEALYLPGDPGPDPTESMVLIPARVKTPKNFSIFLNIYLLSYHYGSVKWSKNPCGDG